MHAPAHLAADLPKTLELHSVLGPRIAQCVTPIVGSIRDRSYQYGTGTLFRAGSQSFLVTAAHVLSQAKEQDALLRLFDARATVDEQEACESIALPKWTAYVGQEPADVAVVPLSTETVAGLPNRRFLHLNEVELRAKPPGGCWVMGYPAEMVGYTEGENRMRLLPFLLAAPFILPESTVDNFDADYNFLLDAKRDELWWPDGRTAEMPNRLDGISGCSVWQVLWPDGTWHPDRARIVGVQVGYYRTRSAVKATHWAAVAKLLHEYHPELRDVLDLHLTRR